MWLGLCRWLFDTLYFKPSCQYVPVILTWALVCRWLFDTCFMYHVWRHLNTLTLLRAFVSIPSLLTRALDRRAIFESQSPVWPSHRRKRRRHEWKTKETTRPIPHNTVVREEPPQQSIAMCRTWWWFVVTERFAEKRRKANVRERCFDVWRLTTRAKRLQRQE
jgi:hypothetical protein